MKAAENFHHCCLSGLPSDARSRRSLFISMICGTALERLKSAACLAGATWEGEGDYPWLKKDDKGEVGDYPLEKYELDHNLSDLASKYIEEKGKADMAEHDDLLKKLTDTKNYLPASKYSVSSLYYKVFQLEREIWYILGCLKSVRTHLHRAPVLQLAISAP